MPHVFRRVLIGLGVVLLQWLVFSHLRFGEPQMLDDFLAKRNLEFEVGGISPALNPHLCNFLQRDQARWHPILVADFFPLPREQPY